MTTPRLAVDVPGVAGTNHDGAASPLGFNEVSRATEMCMKKRRGMCDGKPVVTRA